MTVFIEPIGNLAELHQFGNALEWTLYNVFTEHRMITQFQVYEVNKEVLHDGINDNTR